MRIRKVYNLFKSASNGFIDDNAFKLAAALSYYTVFALGPLLIIVISLAGLFYGEDAAEGSIYFQLNGLLGPEAAKQIQDIINNIQQTEASTAGAIIGGIILLIGATGVFTEMQDSINYIWSVKAKPKKSWLKFLMNRLLSFSIVIGMGFLLLVSLVINAVLNAISLRLTRIFPNSDIDLFASLNMVILVITITGLFAAIFKLLPDATISWRDALIGAVLTAALFLLGKILIGYYLGRANLGVTYGTAASIVILLIWVYYSALILYFGAEFTKMYAIQAGEGIRPKETAVFIIKSEAKEIPESYLDT
ncbi:MAG TPA: YihY/virulence factor BrkB family protein [Chitinophagaceae bacterium]